MVVGILVGWLFPDSARDVHRGWAASDLNVLSSVFLRMIKSLIVPLLFATLVVGIAGHGDDMKRVGRLALRSIVYFEIITTLALAVGLIAVNVIKPGRGVDLGAVSAKEGAELAATHTTLTGVIEHTVPQSFFEAASTNQVLQIVFFAIIFAVALSQVQGPGKAFMLSACESLSEVMFKFVGIVMVYAPIGIGAAIAVTVSKSGLGVLRNLGILVATLYGSLIVFALFVLLPVALIFRVPLGGSCAPFASRGSSRSRRRRRRPRSRWPWSGWSSSACRAASWRSCCRRATRSTWTAARCICRSRRCSRRRRRGSTCRSPLSW